MRKFPPPSLSLSFFLSVFHPFNSLAPARVWKHRHHGIRNRRDAASSVQANNRIPLNGPQQRTRALWILHQGVRSWARRDRANFGHPLFWGSSAPRDRVCRITTAQTRISLHSLTNGLLGIRSASQIPVLGLGSHLHVHPPPAGSTLCVLI